MVTLRSKLQREKKSLRVYYSPNLWTVINTSIVSVHVKAINQTFSFPCHKFPVTALLCEIYDSILVEYSTFQWDPTSQK